MTNLFKSVLVLVTLLVTLTNTMVDAKTIDNNPERPLQQLTVSGFHSGVTFELFYDPELAAVALQVGEHLSHIYDGLASSIGVDPATVEWSEVALVRPGEYIPPRVQAVRWPLVINDPDQLEPELLERLYFFIAHEQTHAVQKIVQCPKLPRWFAEGQAMWAEYRIGEQWMPGLAAKKLADVQAKAGTSKDLVKLGSWGGMTVKRSAIYRQVSASDQQKMDQDPAYSPVGPFKLGPGDLISDESNTPARYHLSFQLFQFLEQSMGYEHYRQFIRQVFKSSDCATPSIIKLLPAHIRTEVRHWLTER